MKRARLAATAFIRRGIVKTEATCSFVAEDTDEKGCGCGLLVTFIERRQCQCSKVLFSIDVGGENFLGFIANMEEDREKTSIGQGIVGVWEKVLSSWIGSRG